MGLKAYLQGVEPIPTPASQLGEPTTSGHQIDDINPTHLTFPKQPRQPGTHYKFSMGKNAQNLPSSIRNRLKKLSVKQEALRQRGV